MSVSWGVTVSLSLALVRTAQVEPSVMSTLQRVLKTVKSFAMGTKDMKETGLKRKKTFKVLA